MLLLLINIALLVINLCARKNILKYISNRPLKEKLFQTFDFAVTFLD